jgi:electron transfer flavoprotein beta subunit
MKILVCISKTPDTTAKIAFTDNNTKFAEAGVQWIINPYDEWYALVRAIELKEADASTVIHLATVGGADAEPIIRKALALGGDEAIRINTQPLESYQVAAELAAVAKDYDLILLGKETIDYNGGAVGGMLAETLDLPYVANGPVFKLQGPPPLLNAKLKVVKKHWSVRCR